MNETIDIIIVVLFWSAILSILFYFSEKLYARNAETYDNDDPRKVGTGTEGTTINDGSYSNRYAYNHTEEKSTGVEKK